MLQHPEEVTRQAITTQPRQKSPLGKKRMKQTAEDAYNLANTCAEYYDVLQILQKRLDENPTIVNVECVYAVSKLYHEALREFLFK
jgi:hypothetical protein